jgi:hypothetical protein
MKSMPIVLLSVGLLPLPALADLPTFAYALEGTAYSLESRCSSAKKCFPVVVTLREDGKPIRELHFEFENHYEWDRNLLPYQNRGYDLEKLAMVDPLDFSGGPFLRSSGVADLVEAPVVAAGVDLSAISEYRLWPEKSVIRQLRARMPVERAVFQRLVFAFWPAQAFSPRETGVEFEKVAGAIRIEGRGLRDAGGARALYLACIESDPHEACREYQFILERNDGNERAFLGSPFSVRSPEGFKGILEARITQLVNGADFRAFYRRLNPDPKWANVQGPYVYKNAAIPETLAEKWRAFVSRNVRAWQLKPVAISTEKFEELLSLLSLEEFLRGRPCEAENRLEIGNSDGQIPWARVAFAQRMGITLSPDADDEATKSSDLLVERFFTYLFETRACAIGAPPKTRLTYDIDPHGKNKSRTCIEWRVDRPDSSRDDEDRVLRDCRSNWTIASLQQSVDHAISAAQRAFRRYRRAP